VLLFIAQHAQGGKFGPGGPGGAGGFGGGMGGIGGTNQIRFQIIVAQSQAKTAVDTANTTITANVAAGQAAIDAELKAAKDKEATVVGSAACVQQHAASLAQVNSQSVGPKCDQALQLLGLQGQVSLLAGLHAELSQVYVMCPFWPIADRATCVENFTAGITLKVDTSLTGVIEGANAVTTNSGTCVAGEVQNAHNTIAAANQALDQCVAN